MRRAIDRDVMAQLIAIRATAHLVAEYPKKIAFVGSESWEKINDAVIKNSNAPSVRRIVMNTRFFFAIYTGVISIQLRAMPKRRAPWDSAVIPGG